MKPRNRILLLIVIMGIIVLTVAGVAVRILYRTALEEERLRLIVTAKSQARLIEAVARFDRQHTPDYPGGAAQATLDQIKDAHAQYHDLSQTGEFTLSRRENDQIVFILNHRHYDHNKPKPVAWNSRLAEPMRQALSGRSGTIIGLDYRGEMVLAAFEPVSELNLGIVAKIDLAEVRYPFLRAGVSSGLIAVFLIVIGAVVFVRITDPIIEDLQETVTSLERTLGEVKTLRGILPICSFCKKIRNDKGYWDQVEVYVSHHTDADFSHSICPDCLARHYPGIDIK